VHTRLGETALRWQERGRSDALLRGEELLAAKTWLQAQPRYAPEPALLTYEYIKASEEAEDARLSEQRKQLDEIAAAQAARQIAIEEREAATEARSGGRKGTESAAEVYSMGFGSGCDVIMCTGSWP
jgi:hypothetical protein